MAGTSLEAGRCWRSFRAEGPYRLFSWSSRNPRRSGSGGKTPTIRAGQPAFGWVNPDLRARKRACIRSITIRRSGAGAPRLFNDLVGRSSAAAFGPNDVGRDAPSRSLITLSRRKNTRSRRLQGQKRRNPTAIRAAGLMRAQGPSHHAAMSEQPAGSRPPAHRAGVWAPPQAGRSSGSSGRRAASGYPSRRWRQPTSPTVSSAASPGPPP